MPKSTYLIATLPGDGIGQEVAAEAVKVLRAAAEKWGFALDFREASVGGTAYDLTGHPLPPETATLCDEADAILFGAVGGPKWDNLPHQLRPEAALLGLRKRYGLFANLRPIKVYPTLAGASPLREEIVGRGVDILILRELTGDIYYGQPRGIEDLPDGTRRGINTMVYTTTEIERIVRMAFEIARARRKKVTSVDKANVLETTRLWREVAIAVGQDFPDVELDHLLVDNAAMQLIRRPFEFDVIVTTNMFGDILSDEAAMLTGSIGLLPSASLGEGSKGFYEPIHGSAPDIAGQGKANPLATILAGAMMLRHSFGLGEAARDIERAVEAVLNDGYRSGDIFSPAKTLVGTREMGDEVARRL